MNKNISYTVKQVAKLSGVSVRTLHFYDEINLLKPAYYGENGYRYYKKEELLKLQQILFYRELGFDLAIIQKIVSDPQFDKIQALRSHRQHLEKEAQRTQQLLQTIDKTLASLEAEAPVSDEELYLGFDHKKQAQYEKEIIQKWGSEAEDQIKESRQRTKDWKKDDYDQVKKDYDELHQKFVEMIKKGLPPSSPEAQKLTQNHFDIVNRFWTPNRDSYIGLGQTYCEHPDFRKLYDGYHNKLAEYLCEAIKIFAQGLLA